MCNQLIHEFDYELDVTNASMDNGLVVVNCKFQLASNFQFFFLPFADLNFECSKSRDVSTSTYYVVNHDVYYL